MNVNSTRVSGDFTAQNINGNDGKVGKLDGMNVTQDVNHRGSVKDKIADAFRNIGNFFKSIGSRIAKALTPAPRQPKEHKPMQTVTELNKTLDALFPWHGDGGTEVKAKKSGGSEVKSTKPGSSSGKGAPSNMTEMMDSKALGEFKEYAKKQLIDDGLNFYSNAHQAVNSGSLQEMKQSIGQLRENFTNPDLRKQDLVLHTRDGECKRMTNEIDAKLAEIEQQCQSPEADPIALQGELKRALGESMKEYSGMLQEHLLRFNAERK